jgi:hypothetical protein
VFSDSDDDDDNSITCLCPSTTLYQALLNTQNIPDDDDDEDNSKTCLCPSEEEEEEEELTLEDYEVMETEEYMDTTPHDEMDCVNENYICDFLCLKFNYKVFTQL